MRISPTRALLGVALLILLAAYATIYRPAEASLAERFATLQDLQTALERAHHTLAEQSANSQETSALVARLRASGMTSSRADAVRRFLHTMGEVAAAQHIEAQRIVPTGPPEPLSLHVAPGRDDDLPLDVTLRGTYIGVINAARALATRTVTARVTVSSLRSTRRRPGRSPDIDATLHVVILRATPDATLSAPLRSN